MDVVVRGGSDNLKGLNTPDSVTVFQLLILFGKFFLVVQLVIL